MPTGQDRLRKRIQSIRFRIDNLTGLRRLVSLSPEHDIDRNQWAVIEPQLAASSARLTRRLRRASESLLPRVGDRRAVRELNAALGQIELDMSRAYVFFDTYMDVLTQRQSAELGPVLAGCDVLASEAMRRDHPVLAIIEPPLVYCERGIGAAIARESVPFPDGTPNPMPLIQIPYARLNEKHNLTSLLHEAGHQALYRLQLTDVLPRIVASALLQAGASKTVAQLYSLWMFEIAPDFWAFGLTGVAEAAAVSELFAMPPSYAMRISPGDPHPPPYLRALICFDWCRRAWGMGQWDQWERTWLESYPTDAVPSESRRLLEESRRCIPIVSQVLFEARLKLLGGRRLLDLLDLDAVAPAVLKRSIGSASKHISLHGLSPCAQLAAFRMIREWNDVPEERLDRLMTGWLVSLGARRGPTDIQPLRKMEKRHGTPQIGTQRAS